MKKIVVFLLVVLCSCCESPTQFSEEALRESFINLDGKEQTFQSILEKHKDKKILIDIWASWCVDCVKTFPTLRKLQNENPEVSYVFLSLDRSLSSWKKGIDRFQIEGDQYFMKHGKKGVFADFLNLWWIPRYVVVNEKQEITLYKATKISDKKILEALKK